MLVSLSVIVFVMVLLYIIMFKSEHVMQNKNKESKKVIPYIYNHKSLKYVHNT